MLRQHAKIVALSLYLGDLVSLIVAFPVAYWIRDDFFSAEYGTLYPLQDYLSLWLGIVLIWSLLFYYFQLYDGYRTEPLWTEPWILLKVTLWGILIVGLIVFALKLHYVSRLLIVIFGVTSFLLISSGRVVLRLTARYFRKRGVNVRNILIVGTGSQALEIAETIANYKDWGLRVSGIVADSDGDHSEIPGHYPISGTIKDIPHIITHEIIDEVIFAVSRNRSEELENAFLICEEQGIKTRVAMNFFPHVIAKPQMEDLAGIPLLTFATTPYNELALAFKRVFDICVSGSLLLVLAPLFAFIGVAVRLTSPGPIFFLQRRTGMNGRPFTLYKFRSMVVGAEDMKEDLLHLNEMEGPTFKIAKDPRVTPIGKLIRKYSLDELPQLINVLIGEMSIVGPRPPVPAEVVHYKPWQRRRLSMKPGLTCLWQIQGRSQIKNFDNWMRLDLRYIDNWSLKMDFKIFFKTIPLVLLGRGAS